MMKYLALLPALGLATQTNEFHALVDVDLGAAFDVSLGTQGLASALEMGTVPLCAINKTATSACLEIEARPKSVSYVKSLSSEQDHNDIMKVVAEAEGGGWGVTLNAGGTYQRLSSVSSSSVDLLCGTSMQTHEKRIKFPEKLALSEPARALLTGSDPKRFIESHGAHFISDIVYGGSFLGSFHLTKIEQKDSKELSAFAKLDASKVYADTNASASFSKQVSSSSSSVKVSSDISRVGGDAPEWPSGNGTGYDLGEQMRKWEVSLIEKNAVPLTMIFRNYYDLEEVQLIVDNFKDPAVAKLFKPDSFSPLVVADITEEVMKLQRIMTGAAESKTWTCALADAAWTKSIEALSSAAETALIKVQRMTELAALDVQQNIIDGNSTWKASPALQTTYDALVGDEFVKQCQPPPTPAPTPQNCWKDPNVLNNGHKFCEVDVDDGVTGNCHTDGDNCCCWASCLGNCIDPAPGCYFTLMESIENPITDDECWFGTTSNLCVQHCP